MTFVDDIMVAETAKNKSSGWPDVTKTAWAEQTNVFYCTEVLLTSPEKNLDKPGTDSFELDPQI